MSFDLLAAPTPGRQALDLARHTLTRLEEQGLAALPPELLDRDDDQQQHYTDLDRRYHWQIELLNTALTARPGDKL